MARGKKKVTLKDIAQIVGLSAAQVSNILNGKDRAPEDVRSRVIGVLRKHGFSPSFPGKPVLFLYSLSSNKTPWMALCFTEILEGISRVVSSSGHNLHLMNLSENEDNIEGVFKDLPGGILVMTNLKATDSICIRGEKAGIPVVQLGFDCERQLTSYAVVDSYDGAYQAVSFLARSGHKRIGMIRWGDAANNAKKFAGYCTALETAGIGMDSALVVTACPSINSLPNPANQRPGREALERLLSLPNPPTAIFVSNNFIAPSIMYPLLAPNGSLPQNMNDLDVVYFGDIPIGYFTTVSEGMLAARKTRGWVMEIDWRSIGAQAAMILMNMINDEASKGFVRLSPMLREL